MTKQYMDFVTSSSAPAPVVKKPTSRAPILPSAKPAVKKEREPILPPSKSPSKPKPKPEAKPAPKPAPKVEPKPAPKPAKRPASTIDELGIIEELTPVKPTPASSHFATEKAELKKAKSEKIGNKAKPEKKLELKKATGGLADKRLFSAPTPPFINQEKVSHRPLSKNIYPKKEVVVEKEVKKGPVTIIAKPEKDAHVGLIVTVILTIILGAAAGTVAFLLLPK